MSASSWIYNHPNPDDADNDSFAESYDFDSRTTSSYCSSSWWQEPMVVGYAFGPKKMSTMSVVMAEASRAEVIHEEQDDEQNLFYTKTIIDSHMEDINLEKYIFTFNPNNKKIKIEDKIISDCCEALIGALYLDKGLNITEKIILNLWKNHIKKSVITQIDAKTKLQELALKKFKKLPIYKLISNTGPRHKPLFKVGVKLPNTKYFISLGKCKKDAEQNAAIECLKNNK